MLNSCATPPIDSLTSPSKSHASYAKPQPGRSLGGAILAAQKPFRAAVAALSESANVENSVTLEIFGCSVLGPGASIETPHSRLAWLLVNACFVHATFEEREHLAPIVESSTWFFGSRKLADTVLASFSPFTIRAADQALRVVRVGQELWDLYPYIIEPHGHVSRSCLQKEEARTVRKSKKAEGVYYTPSDVADFMVSELAGRSAIGGAWIDPACGTGVFLRSIITHAKRTGAYADHACLDFIQDNVFGIDKSALATDSCAFVLLAETKYGLSGQPSPFELWKRLKQNVACMDALHLAPNDWTGDLFSSGSCGRTLSSIFPRNTQILFSYLIMNPPYAVSKEYCAASDTWLALQGASDTKVDLHLAFTEMMWRLDAIDAAAAVLPLSVATNTTRVYTKVRSAYLASSGCKEMLFFDREPQALFGEDIKTRNSVLFRFGSTADSFHTSQLLKWTGPQREQIFNRERLVPVSTQLCTSFVPKLGSCAEVSAYELLCQSNESRATKYANSLSRRTLDQLVRDHKSDAASISIGGTAYNFLNAFFSCDLAHLGSSSERLSSSPTIFMSFPDEETALSAYALLASRIAFWLWRVEGDGFHVTSDFINKLPLWSLLSEQGLRRELAELGTDLRRASVASAAKSVNAGRETYSFHCGFDRASSRKVEDLVLSRLLGSTDFSFELDRILHVVTSIDGKTRRAATI